MPSHWQWCSTSHTKQIAFRVPYRWQYCCVCGGVMIRFRQLRKGFPSSKDTIRGGDSVDGGCGDGVPRGNDTRERCRIAPPLARRFQRTSLLVRSIGRWRLAGWSTESSRVGAGWAGHG